MSADPKKIAERPVTDADSTVDALLEELRQAQAEMERLSKRVAKLLGKQK